VSLIHSRAEGRQTRDGHQIKGADRIMFGDTNIIFYIKGPNNIMSDT